MISSDPHLSANSKTKRREKKSVSVIPPFKRKVGVSLFTQDVLAMLHSLIIDTKFSNRWSQADIARRIDMDETQLSRLLSGRQVNMTVETIALIAMAMDHEARLNLVPNYKEDISSQLQAESDSNIHFEWSSETDDSFDYELLTSVRNNKICDHV